MRSSIAIAIAVSITAVLSESAYATAIYSSQIEYQIRLLDVRNGQGTSISMPADLSVRFILAGVQTLASWSGDAHADASVTASFDQTSLDLQLVPETMPWTSGGVSGTASVGVMPVDIRRAAGIGSVLRVVAHAGGHASAPTPSIANSYALAPGQWEIENASQLNSFTVRLGVTNRVDLRATSERADESALARALSTTTAPDDEALIALMRSLATQEDADNLDAATQQRIVGLSKRMLDESVRSPNGDFHQIFETTMNLTIGPGSNGFVNSQTGIFFMDSLGSAVAVPEPGTGLLLGLGCILLAWSRAKVCERECSSSNI